MEDSTIALALYDTAILIFRYGILTALSLAFVILIHEFGHYLVARFFNVRIEKFSIGFGKEIIGRTDKAGTRWSLSRIPIGGYVSIFGDVDVENPVIWDKEKECERRLSEKELEVAFCTKTVWQRMLIVAAGPLINFLLCISLLAGIYMFQGLAIIPTTINAIAIDTASYDAGFKLGDKIIAMDGKKLDDLRDLYKRTREEFNIPIDYLVLRDGKEIKITMASREVDFYDRKGIKRTGKGRTGMLNGLTTHFDEVRSVDGIDTVKDPDKARELLIERMDKEVEVGIQIKEKEDDIFITKYPSEANKHLSDPRHRYYDRILQRDPEDTSYKRLNPFDAYARAIKQVGKVLAESYKIVSVFNKGKTKEPLLGGVKKTGEYVGQSAKEGIRSFLSFIAILSLVIAILNILPIPLLDGGYLVFLGYEAITGQPISPRIQRIAFIIGLVFLGGIMIIANLVDLIYTII